MVEDLMDPGPLHPTRPVPQEAFEFDPFEKSVRAWSNLHATPKPSSRFPLPLGPPDPPDQASALGLGACPFHFCGKN